MDREAVATASLNSGKLSRFNSAMKDHQIARKILVDTDPGGDDIFALLWLQSLVKKGVAELVGVTTADGNVGGEFTFRSACKVLEIGGFKDVEVGRAVPLNQPTSEDAAHIHGGDGMGNLSQTLPEPTRQFNRARYADEMIIEALEAAPGEITIIGLAPFGNLAAAEAKKPGILTKAREIVMMGGAFKTRGNVTPVAEFNVGYNPEAAQRVLSSREDMVVVSLDVTREVIFRREMSEAIARVNPNHSLAKFILALTEFMIGSSLRYRETNGIEGFLVHDAVTVAYLFYPETLLFQRGLVGVEMEGKYSRGQTILEERPVAKTRANAWVSWQCDRDNLLASLVEDLKELIAG